MALALGLGWQHCWGHGGQEQAKEKLFQDKSSVLSDHSCFHLGGQASDCSPFIALVAAVAL